MIIPLWLAPLAVVTTSPAAYTASAVPILNAEIAKSGVTIAVVVKEPLTLSLDNNATISLDRPWAVCSTQPAECDKITRGFLAQIAQQAVLMKKGDAPVTAARLRIVARDADYVALIHDKMPTALTRPLAGAVHFIMMVDSPVAARPATREDLKAMKLDERQAWTVAAANVETIPSAARIPTAMPAEGLGFLDPRDYYNAGLLASKGWAALAKHVKGKLLVNAASGETVLFADSAQPGALAALTTIGAQILKPDERRLPPQILVWTPSGWQLYTP